MDIKKAEDIIDKMYQDKMSIRVKQKKEGIEVDLSKNITFTELEEASITLLRNYLILKRKNEESNQIFEENEVLKRAFNRQSKDIGNYLVELQQKDKQIDELVKYIDSNNYVDNEECQFQWDFKIDKCIEKGDCKDCIKQYFETKAKKKGE